MFEQEMPNRRKQKKIFSYKYQSKLLQNPQTLLISNCHAMDENEARQNFHVIQS